MNIYGGAMSLLQSLILGIVEGVTEFLPISSTGHMILTSAILKMQQTEALKTFEIAIQLGAILSVLVIYWKKVFCSPELFKKIITAFIPTAALGLVLYKVIKKMFMGNMAVVLWALFIGGFAIIALELFYKKRGQRNAADLSAISYKQAFFIGIFQSLAFIPGVSRSAATIFGGLFMGLKREAIVEFSFLLAIPTMLAAAGLDILKTRAVLSQGDIGSIMIGFITAFVIALASIKWFVGFIKKNDFIPFGIYRIALVALFWLFVK